MQRDMQELREEEAASAKSAQSEKELFLQLEKDLKAVCAELAEVKEEAAKNKRIADKAIQDLNAGLERCRKGINAMTKFIFGKCHPPILCLFNCLIWKYYSLISFAISLWQVRLLQS